MALSARSILDVSDLNSDEVFFLLKETKKLKEQAKPHGVDFSQNLSKSVALMFFEPSTRTRTSFEMAAFRLGLRVLNFSVNESSVKKGETVFDTAKNIEALKPDAMVVRHGGSGIPYKISQLIKIPVINAGDGFHAHPTQALLDAYTIWERFNDFKNLEILIIGDIAHSRVARSNIKCLKMLGAKITICAPPTLIPPFAQAWGVKISHNLDEVIAQANVVMSLRMQLERQSSYQVPSLKEYSSLFGITFERLKAIRKDAIILHPGPVNRGVEFISAVFRDERSKVMEQVSNGALMRSVLLSEVMGVPR
ncbi:MAG: aspartate carbamoyltransferase catalytic subunit [Oligoflexia bacterium]|nr:aspartate carbamoyltransferase catalytic subunit [Oligoflexia bacterium]